jgi:hypothetical protein
MFGARKSNLNRGWEGPMKQHVILYDNDKGETQVYTTAYDDHDIKTQIVNCVARYGKGAKVRSCLAEMHLPEGAS